MSEDYRFDRTDRDFYYKILRVPRNATQHEINNAYEALAYAHDSQNDIEIQRTISKAYQVLSDPNKRRQYDLDGLIEEGEEYSGLDVQNLGGIGRVFGAMISRFGVPLQTQICQNVLKTASAICSNGGIVGGGTPLDSRVQDLVWGWSFDGKVGRQDAVFYRITVDQHKAENGFIVFCRSLTGKFKLVMFDCEGSVMHIEESLRSRDGSQWETALYFTTAFPTYHLAPPLPPSLREEDLPAVFGSLEVFDPCNLPISPGQYLVCVYGDNFIGKTSYNLLAVPTLNECDEAKDVQKLDKAVLKARAKLSDLKEEYIKAKEAFERVSRQVKVESAEVDDLIERREFAYSSFMVSSANAFLPSVCPPEGKSATGTRDAGAGSGVDDVVQQATATAAAAGGWMASTFSSGLLQFNKLMSGGGASDQSKHSASIPSTTPSYDPAKGLGEEESDQGEDNDEEGVLSFDEIEEEPLSPQSDEYVEAVVEAQDTNDAESFDDAER
mmetsp:Transcript_6714/g.10144  ORF Transcript_6714/g.10144 Transcript_6714/m.10144 type:complete len:497 (+) Transcript_6714:79-1569(+)|eukprot:CAMPEP_0185022126 /NCGR_PEP_ID=MMETSP1103-20130426/4854_1 /TAXON_ID=36769 /ORGANISM="Paraphysomonas bandaiensis, Strain Caron Lab Isolate" /LENGTH=496 /DNA_ID=CAMNT_0027554081 /DNA_START=144 /DNA_END=1634 /DNA_ORIENTATION=-